MEKQYLTQYPSDVSEEEWAFVAPYLTLCREDAPQREHALRAVFNGLRYIVRTGNQWRFMAGDLLALHVTAASEQDRAQVERLAEEVQQITGRSVELAYVDQGYTGQTAADAAARHGIQLQVVKHTEAKRGFVLLPRRWVVERSFAWAARFRRLARDYERLGHSLAGYHYFAFAWIMLAQLTKLLNKSA